MFSSEICAIVFAKLEHPNRIVYFQREGERENENEFDRMRERERERERERRVEHTRRDSTNT